METTSRNGHARQSARESNGALAGASLGSDLRALRKTKGLTLSELALQVGRSVGYLSQIERGLSELSIGDLRKLAESLDAPLSWFFVHEGVPAEERGVVVRSSARRSIGSMAAGLTEELLSPDLGGAFEVIRSLFEPGAELSEAQARESEETGYVISGELDLWIGAQQFRVSAGDSFRIDHEPYRWRNPGRVRAEVIWVIAPPVY
ncbi:helix-turn-helix domain-containing protein [Pelagibius litoralis]|uniref:Helix-turn-helix domain-containing protein n=1 Tax=Pelagibius litoralis TaxID=374515 RepID=A0A967F0P4_9PROT|nr:cupin domain-containing protein [Pelagibius litoralis]NIA70925.1 helix-turn-helix domain-containing protein [Pelagibius litoralis]